MAVIKYHDQSNPEKKGLLSESTLGYDSGGLESIDRSFCPDWSRSLSVPNKYIEAYINQKLFGLLAEAY